MHVVYVAIMSRITNSITNLLANLGIGKQKVAVKMPEVSIHDLSTVFKKYGSATATFRPTLTMGANGGGPAVKNLVELGMGDEGIKTVVVKYDASWVALDGLTEAKPRIACVDPTNNTLTVVYPVGSDGQDVFPDGVHHSKSVACILWREDDVGKRQVLLVTEKAGGYTSFVAGGLKWQENSVSGCAREVKEEVGLDVDVDTLKWIATKEMPRAQPYGELNTLTTFACKARDGWTQKMKLQAEEIKDAAWYDIQAALDVLPFESARRALRAFEAGKGMPVDTESNVWCCDDV